MRASPCAPKPSVLYRTSLLSCAVALLAACTVVQPAPRARVAPEDPELARQRRIAEQRRCQQQIEAWRSQDDPVARARLLDDMTPACQKRLQDSSRADAAPVDDEAPTAPADATTSETSDTYVLCLLSRPLPACARMLLLEVGFRTGDERLISADFGVLFNVGTRHAGGATAGLFGFGGTAAYRFSLRFRRWLGGAHGPLGGVGLDVSAGMFLSHLEDRDITGRDRGHDYTGGVVEIALGLGDLLAITAGLNTWRYSLDAGTSLVATVGLRFGLGPIVAGMSRLPRLMGPSVPGVGPLR